MTDKDTEMIRSLDRAAIRAEEEGKAIQEALKTHAVVDYVLNLPIESPLYPAIIRKNVRCLKQSKTTAKVGQEIRQETQSDYIIQQVNSGNHLMTWSMPGHDKERPIRKGCGIIRSSSGSVVVTACENDHNHHLKAKQKHCWSRHCPKCMNDTCIRDSIEIEKKFLTFKTLKGKQGVNVGDIGHWVVSPPQEGMKYAMQTFEGFDSVAKYIEASLLEFGVTAGYTIFHPWRQKKTKWELSPHFHIMAYGRIDTTSFRNENPGWIIKKIHPNDKIRSIHLTVAYLLTHSALGSVEMDASEIDWDLLILNHFDPGILSKDAKFTDDDYNNLAAGKGRMVGDLSDMDWTEWTMDHLYKTTRTRVWGGIAKNKLVKADNFKQYKIRLCKECGAFLRVYQDVTDTTGDYIRYVQNNPVMCFSTDKDAVQRFISRYKSRLREDEELSLADLVKLIPTATTPLEFMPQNNDLIMPGPFDEPDSFFLKRQTKAIGIDQENHSQESST